MVGKIYDIISLYTNGEKLNVNYLNESEPSYAIKPVGDAVVRKYLGDLELRQFTFDLWYVTFFGDDVNVNMESLEKMRVLAERLENHEDNSFAFFAVEQDEPPHIESENISMAKYKMRMNVTYAM